MGEPEKISTLTKIYENTILRFPWAVVLITFVAFGFFIQYVNRFTLDASSDSIVLERDADLRYYSYTRDLFGSDDYVFVAITPTKDLFADETIAAVKIMRDAFQEIPKIASATSYLSVPLFHSPTVPLLQLAKGFKTLENPECDRALAKVELTSSPFYKDHLINEEGTTTAILLTFEASEPRFMELYNRRADLNDKKASEEGLTGAEAAELKQVSHEYDAKRGVLMEERKVTIAAIRKVIDENRSIGELYLGGVPMIMVDIIDYVEKDIRVFGVGIALFLMVLLGFVFREAVFIIAPFLTCVLTVLVMMGYLGWTDWRATIVSSNFTTLLLVYTLATSVHVIVRYLEVYSGNPLASKRWLMREAVRHVVVPSFIMVATTIVGFGSLYISGIRPVMDFALMMMAGLAVAYAMAFLFMPALILVFPKSSVPPHELSELTSSPVTGLARFTERHGRLIGWGSLFVFLFGMLGASRLDVENRFIDYFHKSTPIYKGMTVIDERLGGTTPLEVVLKAPEGSADGYWLEADNLAKLRKVHEWLDALPETGKVLSPDTLIRMLEGVNNNKPVPKPIIQMGLAQLPPDLRAEVVQPYVSKDFKEVRIAMRVRESSHDLDREALVGKINAYFNSPESPVEVGTARLTGLFVLYNNLLQSLWSSQIVTLGSVFVLNWVMFVLLYRSFFIATIAIIPNAIPSMIVLGAMGWSGVPLDIMTIMIAAIAMGTSEDYITHYVVRFREEFPKDRNYIAAMYRCHNSIGYSITYTSLMIVGGFSILILSNFIPNIYFGIFTGLSMIAAPLGSLLLLPLLIIKWKPFGKEAPKAEY